MTKTTPEQNKALVLKAFDTLFNKRATTPPLSASGPIATSSIARISRPAARDCSP
jgi:hypothetical protein